MLGLRKSFNARRKRKDSNSSSLVSEHGEEESSARAAMDTIRNGLSDSLSGLKNKGQKTEARPAVSVTEVKMHADEEAQVEEPVPSPNPKAPINGSKHETKVIATSNDDSDLTLWGFGRVKDVFKSVTSLISRSADYNEAAVKETDLRAYLRFISDERLIHMPRRGSDWDRVLSNAQFFGLQVWLFGKKIETYVPGGTDSAAAALASCQVLLEVGHTQAPALLPTFVALYELAMLLSAVGQLRGLERMPPAIKENAAHIFCDLVSLCGNIAVHYRQKITALRAGLSAVIDFDQSFGQQISDIWRAKQSLYDQIWAFKLGRKTLSISIQSLRQKLLSSGEISIRSTLYDEVADSLERSEDTCNWIKHQLTSFLQSKEQVLSITGPLGSGKTMLAEWVQERLSRPLDHHNYVTLDYTFPSDSPEENTAVACVQSLLSQLLERSVGDVALYEQLVVAYEGFSKHRNVEKLEASLWDVLRTGLQTSQQDGASVVIITDGCDGIVGGDKSAIAFHASLRKSVAKLTGARVITFSRPVSHLSDGCRHIVITPQDSQEDIRVHLGQTLLKSPHFQQLDGSARDQLIDELTAKSKGNFLWAYYAGHLFRNSSRENYAKLKQSITSDISNVLQLTVTESRFKNNATLRELLSFMLVAQRPLSVDELADLLAVDITSRTIQSKLIDLLKYVPENCGDIVIIRGGRLHFRSSAVRSYLVQQMGGLLLSLTDAHFQLTQRALLYARLRITFDREPSIDGLSETTVSELFESHKFLLYVVQTWTVHFKHSGLLNPAGQLTIPKGFSELFPDSVTFALIEQSYWQRTYSLETVITLHELSLQVRDATFGSKHVTRVQTLISLSHAHHLISSTSTHSASYLVQAIRLGVTIFSETSLFVSACVSLFLSWTETLVITERTETVTYREEVIRIMIRICKHKHGETSDQVIQWYERLAKLYTDIGEKQHATVVYRELYQIITVRHGKKSEKAREIGAAFGTLDVVFQGEDAAKDIAGLEVLIFETNDDLEASDKLSISMTIRLAQSYLVSGKLYLAERLYLALWRRITLLCTAESRFDIHIAKIQIALEYVKFLHKVDRSEEAANILICLWAEYEHYTSQSEALTVWIREIGISCRSYGLLSIAASILTKVWGWFKSKGKTDSEEAQKTTVLVTEVVEEITEITVTKKTTTITTTEVTETAVKEIYELNYERCQKSKADRAFFSSCLALFGLYSGAGRWADAEALLKRSLELTWTAVLSADLKISLSAHSTKETIVVARQLAVSYQQQGFYEQAEAIHLRIYYACLHSSTFVEELLLASVSHVIDFYQHHHRHEKVIEIYAEVLEKYRKQYGLTHRLTIETLYLLAAQYELLGRLDAAKYYLEIVTILNKGIKHCHPDAVKAALFLCRHYRARKMWVELRTICEGMWGTITLDDKHGGLTIEIITEVYNNYTYVLEVHAKVEFSVIYKLRVQYKDVAIAVAGAVSSAALLAMIELAGFCEKHESHRHESIKIYEEVLKITRTTKTTTTVLTETTVQTVKKRLSTLYVTVITTGKSGTTTKETTERGIELALESYAHLKAEFGCWHETTLLKLKEVVLLYRQTATQEATHKIILLLQASVIEIISTLTVTASLFSSAKLIASIYISAGQVAKGQELLHQLRHLIIFRETWKTSEITLSLGTRVTRAAFAFLIAFELGLSGKTNQTLYSQLMVDIVYESVLFEEYTRVIEKETRLEIILDCGAKLRKFWEEHQRVQLLAILDKKLLQLFVSSYSESFKGIAEADVRVFYLTILAELGKDQTGTKIDLASLACRAGTTRVRTLIEKKDLHQALILGRCVFQFGSKQKLYQQLAFVQYGYKLAELLAGTEIPLPTDAKYDEDKKAMLQTSRSIIVEVLATSRASNIDFARLQFEDLSGLLHLLGAQGNYSELVLILKRLWEVREELQKAHGWSPSMVLRIGNMLIHAQANNNDLPGAIATAELLYYNVRRGRGRLDPETLALSRLLASLYLSAGRASAAKSVHESVLREIASTCQEHDSNRPKLTPEATQQLELLRSAFHQAKAEGKPVSEFGNLYDQVKLGLKLELPAFDQWLQNNKTVHNSKYTTNIGWKLERDVQYYEMWKRSVRARPK